MPKNTANLDIFKNSLQEEVYSAWKKVAGDKSGLILKEEIDLTHPKEENHGDYTTTLALKASKILKQLPLEIADKISKELKAQSENLRDKGIERIEIKPPGFINFWLSHDFLSTLLKEVLEKSDDFGVNFIGLEKLEIFLKKLSKNIKIYQKSEKNLKKPIALFEFADPNPFKEFHIGHLRNICLGESFSRLFENLGVAVKRVNYQGDVGLHVAKAIWGVRKISNGRWEIINGKWVLGEKEIRDFTEKVKILAQGYVLGSSFYEKDKEIKEEIDKLNIKIYQKDPQILPEWHEGRKVSLEAFEKIYKRVDTHFERYYFESEVADLGVSLVREHLQDGVFRESGGAIIFDGEKFGLHKRVFVTGEGYATYEAKDLALAVLKYQEFPYNLSVIITGQEQADYFKVMLKALEQFKPELSQRTLHVPFGMVNLKGAKMSSRTGKVITAEWLLDMAKEKAKELITEKNYSEKEVEEIAEKVALAAVKYSMLKFSAKSDIIFDFEESVSLEGDSGAYLLYTYARCRSVLCKLKNKNEKIKTTYKNEKINNEELALLRTIYRFPEVAFEAAVGFSPNLICYYLFDLAQKYNLFYTKHSILTPKEGRKEVKEFRLALTAAVRQILKNGFRLLGIEMLERM